LASLPTGKLFPEIGRTNFEIYNAVVYITDETTQNFNKNLLDSLTLKKKT
jgi:hypothetical protein